MQPFLSLSGQRVAPAGGADPINPVVPAISRATGAGGGSQFNLRARREWATQSGGMFWLSRKKLFGSYLRLSPFRRSYLAAPYASRIRSSPSSMRKLM
jgi:hypothetical protein